MSRFKWELIGVAAIILLVFVIRDYYKTISFRSARSTVYRPDFPKSISDALLGILRILPNATLTPGESFPNVTAANVCSYDWAHNHRDVPPELRAQVMEEYGLSSDTGGYECDHLISLELGGDNSIKNLWPQSYSTQPYNAHVKDSLENKLHKLVCAGTIDLKTAQHCIASNWIACYHQYME